MRERYARTRHLIELGALVEKSGLIDLISHDQDIFYGAMIYLVTQASSADGRTLLTAWQQLGDPNLPQRGMEDRNAIATDDGSAP